MILNKSSICVCVNVFFDCYDAIFKIGMYLLNISGLKYFNNESTIFLRLMSSMTAFTLTKFNLIYFYNTFFNIIKDFSLESNGDCLIITVKI